MNKEIWKDIKDYEKRYQVSNLGRVKSLSKFINNNPKSSLMGYYSKEIILKQFDNTRGYKLVKLYKNNKKYTKKVHRLVAETFIPNPNNLPEVNHKDGNKENNKVNNLEWCDYKYNAKHAWEIGLCKKKIGKNNKLSKKVYQYDLNEIFIKEWDSVTEAQNKLKIRNISEVCSGKRKKAGGYIWKYQK